MSEDRRATGGRRAGDGDLRFVREREERLRGLAQRLDTKREEERRSVALMLHEGIAQDLAAAKMSLERLQSRPHDERDVARVCRYVGQALQQCIEDLRRGVNELRPTALAHLRLADALADHAERISTSCALRIDVAEINPFPPLDEQDRLLFFRAAQEALNNVVAHACATSVRILLRADAERLYMDISDDGIGIIDNAVDKPGAFGLLGLREKFAAHAGQLSIGRTGLSGTRLSVSLPRREIAAAARSGQNGFHGRR